MTPQEPHPHLQTKETFITLYNTRLFTAGQVWDMVHEATHTPARSAQQRIDAVIGKLESRYAKMIEDGKRCEDRDAFIRAKEIKEAIALLREGEQK